MPDSTRNQSPKQDAAEDSRATKAACPVCGGHLIEIRGKLQCERCHAICETCCEGGPG